jgi:hypothetical protein
MYDKCVQTRHVNSARSLAEPLELVMTKSASDEIGLRKHVVGEVCWNTAPEVTWAGRMLSLKPKLSTE